MDIKKLVRNKILKLKPYKSARKIGGVGDVWLNANESPYNNFFFLKNNYFNRYPEPQSYLILKRYVNYLNNSKISFKNILISRGSDEAIDLLIRAFCNPNKDKIMFFPPTYGMYHISSKIIGIKSIIITTLKNGNLNFKKIKKNINFVKLIFLCRPNNPTGKILSKKIVLYLLKCINNKSLLIIDEAYIEFIFNKNLLKYLYLYPNLVILRTMSKAFSLAGLRCGFVIASSFIIKILLKIIAPYPLSSPVIDLVSQALLKKNIVFMRNKVLTINSNRIWLIIVLKKFFFVKKIFDSSANYLLVYFYYSEFIFKYLWNNGIILRNQNKNYFLKNCIRISIGTKLECLKLIMKLKKLSYNLKTRYFCVK